MESDPRAWIAVLRQSHERLLGIAAPLTAEQLRAPSYCAEWTIAQALSHLGSGAEIALMNLPAALGQAEPAGQDAYGPVWERWNAMSPEDQAAASLLTDAQHVQALDRLTDAELAGISFPLFGMTLDGVGLVRLRLAEHALHTWDVAVALDPAATVAPEAVSMLVDFVAGFVAPMSGKPQETPLGARIRVSDLDREFLLTAADKVTMADAATGAEAGQEKPADAGAGDAGDQVAEIAMPAEALLRLACGRLDADHTPDAVTAKPADLDRLRAVFPGF